MRIRKRLPPPLAFTPLTPPPPLDLPSWKPQKLVKVIGTGDWIFSNGDRVDAKIMHHSVNKGIAIGVGEEESSSMKERFTRTNRSFGYNYNPSAADSAETSSLSCPVIDRWCKEERAFPLKKRRVIFQSKPKKETIMVEDNKKKTRSIASTKENKKWVESEDEYEQEEDEEDGAETERNSAKKRRSESTTMEDLRCRKKNGRGRRCWQRKLGGQTLCKHHLDMVRLQRMRSYQRRRRAASISKPKKVESSSYIDDEGEEGYVVDKKRKKIGVVKARSMSSLLSQAVPLLPVTR